MKAASNDGEPRPGDVISIDLSLLDDNPFQPRGAMDPAKLAELAASIRASGLLQPIAVRPTGPGQYVIVAGHRRVAAFRALQASATTEDERRRFSLIRAHVVATVTDAQLAVAAYVENAQRDDLNPLEEAAALAKIRELGGHSTAAQVADATGQPERRVRRLLRLFAAPKVVKDAVSIGLVVDVHTDSGPKRERRKLELMAALEFSRLHAFFAERKSDTADDRTTTAMSRAIRDNWGFRRIQQWIDQVLHQQTSTTAETAVVPAHVARSVPPKDKGTDEPGPVAPEVCSSSSERFSVYLARLKSATVEQLKNAHASLDDVRQLIEAQLSVRMGKA